jgi:hypothetical protein
VILAERLSIIISIKEDIPMKKLAIIAVCFVVLFCMFSCENANESDTQPTTTNESDTLPATKQEVAVQFSSPTYTDWEEFLDAWAQGVQEINNGAVSVNGIGSEQTLTVPVLKLSAFEFIHVEITDQHYEYYYLPVDYDKDWFSTSHGIIVTVSREVGSFEGWVSQLDLTPIDGIAYDETRYEWIINVEGKGVSVDFPETFPITTKEELYNCFVFEEYTVSGNSGEIQ